jgi:hypothetical protein
MKEISEEDWKKELQKKEKKYERAHDDYQVIRTLDIICGDIIRSISTNNFDIILKDLNNLRTHVNNGLQQIGKQYSGSYKLINEQWDLLSINNVNINRDNTD